ncbi:MAG: adenylyltransferase/cytidyltransferase family protein [Candidatus Thermoplasmatota archaeon]|nr:adenylyltransferase/cytidyltransferase family protein [Candidatus Thermoplasmatota archaeon]
MVAGTGEKYKNVWTGGTFDHFHQGHRDLLDKAFEVSSFVTIGITTNELVADKKYSEFIESLDQRMKSVSSYLAERYGKDRYKFVINDSVYTEAVLDPKLSANIICFKTKHHGRNINKLREEKQITALDLVMAPSSSRNSSSSETRRLLFVEKYGQDPYDGKESNEPTVDRE